jgi:hypothetical protein
VRRALILGLAGAVLAGCGSSVSDVGEPSVDRVLVFSLPGVSWDDLRGHELEHLEQFVPDAAIGDLSTRIGRRDATPTDAYLSLGAGTRALAPDVDRAVALDPDESYGGVPAAEILERRRGAVPAGIFYLAIGAALDRNDRSPYGAEVGTLGDVLHADGISRAVVANADAAEGFVSDEPPPEGAFVRSAATMLMGSNGIVPGGTVGRSLLMDDPAAPFGRRLDPDAVLTAFDEAWSADDRAVVLVEASDLSRAANYGPRATASQRTTLRAEALADSDALLGELLERVDPERDAVLVLSPVSPRTAPALGVAALRAPGVDPGLLESATTRRAGYVQLADVAPTVLTLVGAESPDDLEGRPFQVQEPGEGSRVERLAEAADAAAFRDDILPTVVILVIALLGVLVLALLAGGRGGRLAPWVRSLVAWGAFVALGSVPASFLVGVLDPGRARAPGYLLSLLAVALTLGTTAAVVERWWPGMGVVLSVGAIVGLIAVDVAVGAPLQLNTVFGYSLGVAGRFVGIGNLAFALFSSATLVLGALLAARAGPGGVRAAIGLFVLVVLVEGLPMLGADVGGVLSMVPAFGLTVLILLGRPVGVRETVGLAVGTVVVLLGFAFVDAARAPQSQTHLARLAQHVVDGRWGQFADSLSRRWQASLGGAGQAAWITVAAVLLVAAIYVVLVAKGRIGPGRSLGWDRPTTAGAAGLAVLAVVGLIANDSSFAVPVTMLIVVVPVLVLRRLDAVAGEGVP